MNSELLWSSTTGLGRDVTSLIIQYRHAPCKLADANHLLDDARKKGPTQEDMLHDEHSTKWSEGDLIPQMI